MNEFTAQEVIAYFTMEVALRSEIPTYSGGLGVLAGDTVRSAADLELPFVTVSLVSRAGYFRQEIDTEGRQIEHPDIWQPERLAVAVAGHEQDLLAVFSRIGPGVEHQVVVALLFIEDDPMRLQTSLG